MSGQFLIPRDPPVAWRYLRLRPQRLPAFNGAGRYGLFWARNAIYHALRALEVPAGGRVLVPAYICASAVEPIVSYGATVEFYAVDESCTVDLADVERRIRRETAAVLAVHYFGFPQAMRELRALCDDRGLRLIEDCAHVLVGECGGAPMGSLGDASVFSWRKFLPIYDGGALVVNGPNRGGAIEFDRHGMLFNAKVAWNLLERWLDQPGRRQRALLPIFRALAHARRGRRDGSRADRPGPGINSGSSEFEPGTVNLPISPLSSLILRHSAVEAIAAQRRANFKYLSSQLASISGVRLLHSRLPRGTVPWIAPIIIDEIPEALPTLRRRGVPAVSWSGVRHPSIPAGSFPQADRLYDRLLFLPVHQGLSRYHLDLIVRSVRSVVQEARDRRAEVTDSISGLTPSGARTSAT